ncbi:MAG: crotonase/enoyl-CoA hydratase family protein [Parasphingorhabdus sp.]|uniref:crotonase/enoyl-CoA hydratase family protein n=1 Tax=Parasphingorhabdus sp. TaxID=2709688 RepID=UPI0032674772
MTQTDFFKLSTESGIAHLMLDNANQANCLNDAFWIELPQIMHQLDADTAVRAVVISGEGKHFCAGMDLSSFAFISECAEAEAGRGAHALYNRIRQLQSAFDAVEHSRLPVIAAAHGACIGGAIDFLCACDIRLASRDARFSVAEINVGMAADVGTLQRLPRLIAPGIVKELAYTGRRFDAEEALGWGFVNSVHDDRETVIKEALDMAKLIASKSPLALAGTKRGINYGLDHSVAEGLEQIATWNAGMLRPTDLNAAKTAMQEKRQAVFDDLDHALQI